MNRPSFARLSTQNLLHNLEVIQQQAGKSKLIVMIKANAYGHGLRSVAKRLNGKVALMGVASIDEALALRKAGVSNSILLTQGVFSPEELPIAAQQDFHVILHQPQHLEWLDTTTLPQPLHAWIKVNTGMSRLGFPPKDALKHYQALCEHPKLFPPLRILSHFACADEREHPLNYQQINAFDALVSQTHTEYSLCNSAALWHFPEKHYDYVRPGLALYGISPLPGHTANDLGLKPVMTLQSALIAIQHCHAQDPVGYSARFSCPQDMPIGIVTFGYGDGYPFTAKPGTPVLVGDTLCPLIGQLSMDMLTVDLRDHPNATVGEPVTLWGEGLPIERVAQHTQVTPWVMVTSVLNRVKFLWNDTDA